MLINEEFIENKEIGGYLELERNYGNLYHEKAIALNSGSNCFKYIINARKIKKIYLPLYSCDCLTEVCKKEGVIVQRYQLNKNFTPKDVKLKSDEWIYIINYFGMFNSEKIKQLILKYKRVILDQVQNYFDKNNYSVDSIYSCRKYFGVPDGGFLYTDCILDKDLSKDKSLNRTKHIIGRLENNGHNFYKFYQLNEKRISNLKLRKMSIFTENELRGIDYKRIIRIRNINYDYLEEKLNKYNKLKLKRPNGPFMYPLYIEDGEKIRKQLIKEKIYIPTFWQNKNVKLPTFEENLVKNILPLPIDQRYNIKEMKHISETILKTINKISKDKK